VPAHGGRRLLIFVRIEFIAQHCTCFRKQRRRRIDIDELAGSHCQQRPIADREKTEAEIGEPAIFHDRLRR
jgi:hypothetical protein